MSSQHRVEGLGDDMDGQRLRIARHDDGGALGRQQVLGALVRPRIRHRRARRELCKAGNSSPVAPDWDNTATPMRAATRTTSVGRTRSR